MRRLIGTLVLAGMLSGLPGCCTYRAVSQVADMDDGASAVACASVYLPVGLTLDVLLFPFEAFLFAVEGPKLFHEGVGMLGT